MHQRVVSDTQYLRVEPVSSREQYRWMERFIPTVEEDELRGKTLLIVGYGRIGARLARLAKAFDMRVVGLRRSSGAASTWMCSPSITTWTEARVRLSRGSVEEQTAQSQPIIGTPCDVPVPRKMTSMAKTHGRRATLNVQRLTLKDEVGGRPTRRVGPTR